MTREEAKEALSVLKIYDAQWLRDAIDMAIEALSKPNYESDTEVRLAVTDRNKDKVVLWDAFGEVEYYPHGEISGSHGRLIDADALMKELSDIQPYNWTESEAEIQEEADYSLFKSLINAAPTVQADRPHGEWKVNTDDSCGGITLTCSECGEQFNFDDADEVLDFKEHAHFCIHCGADMRKENK